MRPQNAGDLNVLELWNFKTRAVRISFQEAESLLHNVKEILLQAKYFQSSVAVKTTDL
jgi:hypothetical protein